MTEPKTVKQAKEYTLAKIKKCMELPLEERGKFWIKPIWENRYGLDRYCAFCLVVNCDEDESPICLEACKYYNSSKSADWSKPFLLRLYRMVEEVEV